MRLIAVACLVLCLSMTAAAAPPAAQQHDVVVYGGTSAGIAAAVQAKKMGKSVVVVSPDKHLGGLTSGGLRGTDSGNKAVIGGVSREFYRRVDKEYCLRESGAHPKPQQSASDRRG